MPMVGYRSPDTNSDIEQTNLDMDQTNSDSQTSAFYDEPFRLLGQPFNE